MADQPNKPPVLGTYPSSGALRGPRYITNFTQRRIGRIVENCPRAKQKRTANV
jgi:hypothetical protein